MQLDKESLEAIVKGVLQGLLHAGKEKEMPSGNGIQSGSSTATELERVEE